MSKQYYHDDRGAGYIPDMVQLVNGRTDPPYVQIPNYVFDLYSPLISFEGLGLYAMYCRLVHRSSGKFYGVSQKELARAHGISHNTLKRINVLLERLRFIRIEYPSVPEMKKGFTLSIIVLDPPTSIPQATIDQIMAEVSRGGENDKPREYTPIANWLFTDSDPKGHQQVPKGHQQVLEGHSNETISNRTIDNEHLSASDDAGTPSDVSSVEEQNVESSELRDPEDQENISAAPRPTPPAPPQAGGSTQAVGGKKSRKSKSDEPTPAKKQPKRTRAIQDAALEVLMRVGLDGVRNAGRASKMLKLLDTVVAATLFDGDEHAAAMIVTAENLTAFYKWYDTETNNFQRPQGDSLPDWFIKWWRASGQQLTGTVAPNDESSTGRKRLPAMLPRPAAGYVRCVLDSNYYHHTIIEYVTETLMNGGTFKASDLPAIYEDENGE